MEGTSMMMELLELVNKAGEKILGFYGSEVRVTRKADKSPLTEADQASHELIVAGLRRLGKDWPIISEESEPAAPGPSAAAPRFWLVDPLDGTKEFLKQSGEFTVNVALIENGRPILGIVHAPALGLTYFAERNLGAFRQKHWGPPAAVRVRPADPRRLVVAASRDHAGPDVERLLAALPGATLSKMGSSLKFCLVAAGEADVYLRDLPTMEWDTAAAQCIVEAAGGAVCELSGEPLGYGKPGLRNPGIITIGDRSFPWFERVAPNLVTAN